MNTVRTVGALKQMLARLEAERLPGVRESFSPFPDTLGRVAFARGTLHEVLAVRGADLPAATGFTLALARLASDAGDRPVLWIRQDLVEVELGRPDAPGLAWHGLDPVRLILVRAPNAIEVLRAAGDAVRCRALGALIVEPWGEPKALDLTATRRLALRAAVSGVTSFLLRVAARASPTAVDTRWQVAPVASSPEGAAREANAPGAPAFAATLARHRGGTTLPPEGRIWNLEWDRETRSFRELAPLPRAVVPVPSGRSPGAVAQAAPSGDVVALRRSG